MTTILLVDDDPLEANVRKSALTRRFHHVERAADAAEAFIMVEEPAFAGNLGLVIVALSRPGIGSPAFVAELTVRLPSVPVLVLGSSNEEPALDQAENVRFLPRSVPTSQMLSISRQLMEQSIARVA